MYMYMCIYAHIYVHIYTHTHTHTHTYTHTYKHTHTVDLEYRGEGAVRGTDHLQSLNLEYNL